MYEINKNQLSALRDFFNNKHEIILCTSDKNGFPNASIMGSCRINENAEVEFEVSETEKSKSITLENIKDNKKVMFMTYTSGNRARDFKGVRIYSEVKSIETSGEKLEAIKKCIEEKHGKQKANENKATITCTITNIRPVLDMAQKWEESL